MDKTMNTYNPNDRFPTLTTDDDFDQEERQMIKESGQTRKEYFGATDESKPPFNKGDKVWVESVPGGVPDGMFDLIRKVQTVEAVNPVPSSNVPIWSIDLVGCYLTLGPENLRRA